mmetsp:Transcript_15921/g.22280  ORF Transcript_15921/g.22280 Transcript_15921/m.22280 type:complete len:80 (+) Transcript_15921:258-497(+)
MAQILLQAAALIGKQDSKQRSVKKRTRKAVARRPRIKRSRAESPKIVTPEPEPIEEGRAVELGAWIRSMELGGPTVAVH